MQKWGAQGSAATLTAAFRRKLSVPQSATNPSSPKRLSHKLRVCVPSYPCLTVRRAQPLAGSRFIRLHPISVVIPGSNGSQLVVNDWGCYMIEQPHLLCPGLQPPKAAVLAAKGPTNPRARYSRLLSHTYRSPAPSSVVFAAQFHFALAGMPSVHSLPAAGDSSSSFRCPAPNWLARSGPSDSLGCSAAF